MPSGSIDSILQPLGLARFLAEYWGKRYCHVTGERGRFAHLLEWREVNRILAEHRLDHPRLRVAINGDAAQSSASRYIRRSVSRRGIPITRVDPAGLAAAIREGGTLVFDAVDELTGPVRSLAEAFERVFSEHIQVNAYAAWGATRG